MVSLNHAPRHPFDNRLDPDRSAAEFADDRCRALAQMEAILGLVALPNA
jgi:hypothetical protein